MGMQLVQSHLSPMCSLPCNELMGYLTSFNFSHSLLIYCLFKACSITEIKLRDFFTISFCCYSVFFIFLCFSLCRPFHQFMSSIKLKFKQDLLYKGFRTGIVNLSLQLWHQMNTKKRALNKMLCDNKDNYRSWCQMLQETGVDPHHTYVCSAVASYSLEIN